MKEAKEYRFSASYLSESIHSDGISTVPYGIFFRRKMRPVSQRYYGRLLGFIGPISLCLLLIRVLVQYVIV